MRDLKDGVSVFDFLDNEYNGESRSAPYRPEALSAAALPSRILEASAEFVRLFVEMTALVQRECLVKWADIPGSDDPARPRLVMSISVELSKPRMIINTTPLKDYCRHAHFVMDTISEVAVVAEERVFMGSLYGRSGFHSLCSQPGSWPLFGVNYDGVDYVGNTLYVGWNERSPLCYHSLSEAKAAYGDREAFPY